MARRTVLWCSRHPLDAEAEAALRGLPGLQAVEIETREVMWPSDRDGCIRLLRGLRGECDVLAGVWPAQAVEAIALEAGAIARALVRPIVASVWAPVSTPRIEPDTGKVRGFAFVRWACLLRGHAAE